MLRIQSESSRTSARLWLQLAAMTAGHRQPTSGSETSLFAKFTPCVLLHNTQLCATKYRCEKKNKLSWIQFCMLDPVHTVICKLSRNHAMLSYAIQPKFLLCMNSLTGSAIKSLRPPCISLRVQAAHGVHHLK